MMIFAARVKWSVAAVFFVAVIFIWPDAPGATEHAPFKTVTVMGKSVIRGEDVASARNRAISDGLDTAVELAMLSELTADYLLKHFPAIHQVLYKRTDQFVQDYKVLTETKAGKAYRVLVRATVSVALLEERLAGAGVLLSKKELPRILLLVAERKIEDPLPRYWWGKQSVFFENFSENALVNALKNKGFTIINPLYQALELELGSEYEKPDLTDPQIITLGLYLKADVVVIVQAIAEVTPNTMGADIRSFKGSITARALRLDTREEIVPLSSQSAVTVNTDEIIGGHEALAAAGSLIGEQLANQIAAAWLKEDSQPTMVTLVVGGTLNLKNFETFRRQLEELSGVNEIQIQEMKPDEITMIVDYQDKAQKLASVLMLKTFDAFGLNIYEILEDRINMELVPR